jgi:hypothetical protein
MFSLKDRGVRLNRSWLSVALVYSLSITLALAGAFGISAGQADEPVVALREISPSARGQIVVTSFDGHKQLKITGFFKPGSLSYTSDGRILVFDLISREISSISEDAGTFVLDRTWKLPSDATDPALLASSDSASLFVVDRAGRSYRFAGDSVIEKSSPPDGINKVAGGAVLQDGSVIVLRSEAQDITHSLYIIQPGRSEWTPVAVSGVNPAETITPSGVAALGNQVYLWRGGDSRIISGTTDGSRLTISGKLSYPDPAIVAPDSRGGVSVVTMSAKIARLNDQSQVLSEFQFINLPFWVVFDAKRDALLIAHEHPVAEQWPQIRNRIFSDQENRFAWDQFKPIALSALALAVAWALCAVRWGYESPPRSVASLSETASSFRSYSLVWVFISLSVAICGLYLASGAQTLLLSGLEKESWLWRYVLGAVLVAVSSEVARRRFSPPDEPKRFIDVLKEPAPALGLAYLLPLVSIAAVSGVIFNLGLVRQYNNGYREAVFFAGIELEFSLLLVDAWVCRRALWEWIRREWVFFTVPLLIGVFTLFYKLQDVPYQVHFDFTSHAFTAEQFLRGNKDGWWDWGFVPAPIIGGIPEILGLWLAGFTPLGYRFGCSLFNLSAILAAYILGREYRNPRVGFWAASILAGNTAFVHFGRVMSNGAAATIALWTVTALTLALRYKRSSLWLSVGLISGFAFYQWPVALVGVAAAGLMYGLVYLRFPLRQLRQLPHHLFGLAGLLLLLMPLICIWIAYPERFLPRSGASLTGVNLKLSNFSVDTSRNTLDLFFRSLGWIFSEYDRSSQGSVSPGFNSIDAVLFACGVVMLCLEGVSINILLGLMLLVTFTVCGAWSVGPPWYTRVLPSAPIACLVIARAIEGFHNFFAIGKRRIFWSSFVVISLVVLVISPYRNFKRYYDHETAAQRRINLYPMNIIGRAMHKLGPQYSYVFLVLGEPSWRFYEFAGLAHMFPYISNLKLRESFDVNVELPVPADTPTAFLVQLKRFDLDLAVIKKYHPDAEVVPVEDINHDKVAYLVLVPGRKGRTS